VGEHFVPAVDIRLASSQQSTDLKTVRSHAHLIQALFDTNGLTLTPTSSLGILVNAAKTLADTSEGAGSSGNSFANLFSAIHFERISDSVLALRGVPNAKKYLQALMSGEMDFFSRKTSHAKNIFWEIELYHTLAQRWPSTSLLDPPDILIELTAGRAGIACKKIYSETNFEKVISGAVGQVAAGFDAGIVAFNIDDLTPPGTVLRARSREEVTRFLANRVNAFIQRHRRHFYKYLSRGRVVSAIVSLTVTADVTGGKPRFVSARELTVWSIPGLSEKKMNAIHEFRGVVLSAI
jgi:hypothetical protein